MAEASHPMMDRMQRKRVQERSRDMLPYLPQIPWYYDLNLGVHSFSRTKISWVDQLCKCPRNHAQWCTYETHRHLSIYAVDSQDKASGMSTIVHSEQWEEREQRVTGKVGPEAGKSRNQRAEIRGRKEKGTEEERSGLRKPVEKRDGSAIIVTFNFSKRNIFHSYFFCTFKNCFTMYLMPWNIKIASRILKFFFNWVSSTSLSA